MRLVRGHLRRSVGRAAKPLLRRFGLTIVRADAPPRDLRAVTSDPIEAVYRTGGQPALIDVPLDKCRFVMGAPCNAESCHPFVQCLHKYAQGDNKSVNILKEYYSLWPPSDAVGYLGLDCDLVPCALRRLSSQMAVAPWSRLEPIDRQKAFRILYEKEDNEAIALMTGKEKIKLKGASLNDSKALLHFFRLKSIYESVRSRGYIRSDSSEGDMTGFVMVKGASEWRILLGAGTHRISALATLGYRMAPLRLRHSFEAPIIIRREDVASWPHVRTGLYSSEAALALFDRLFDGHSPPLFPLRPL